MKRQMKDYSQLTDSTKKRLASMLESIHKGGYTLSEAKKLNDKDLKVIFPNVKDLSSYRRLFNQITNSKERREGSIAIAKKVYVKANWTGKGLVKIEKELIKVSGNIFSAISDKVKKTYNLSDREADLYAKKLLLISKSERKNLNKTDYDILDDFSP